MYTVHYDRGDQQVPIKSWADGLEDGALEQAKNMARLPFAFKHVALMPDCHQGFGMPVGGVLATKGYVVPNAIGVDIGCGMSAVRSNLTREDLEGPHKGQGTILKAILGDILRNVPTGNGPGGQYSQADPDRVPKDLYQEILRVLSVCQTEDLGTLTDSSYSTWMQLGSLGGGNHFIELEIDETNRVWIMLHSGSRSAGHRICTYFNRLAKEFNKRWFSRVSEKTDLAFLPLDSEEGQNYLAFMSWAQDYAKANRGIMLRKCQDIIARVLDAEIQIQWDNPIDTHHNYAAMEHHFDQDVLVTRKGAIRAREGDLCIIPGSMETGSYIAEGLGNPESFMSSPHGAGRRMSRTAAAQARTTEDLILGLQKQKVELATHNVAGVVDEGGHAYKDIESVMNASSGLVRPVHHLVPVGVVKGSDPTRKSKNRKQS